LKGVHGREWLGSEVLALQGRAGDARTPGPVLLAPFSIGLSPELLDRLRAAAPELGLPESMIAAAALALFLEGEGF
jgi:hypothetical protein